MFKEMDYQEILFWLFMVGIMIEFVRMVPPLTMKLIGKIRKGLRKVEVQELAEELGGVCKSEDDCNKRLEGTIKDAVKSLGKEIKKDISDARKEFKSGLNRVHDRIDNHLNKEKAA